MEAYLASIIWMATEFAPQGTLEANGQSLPINQYQALFSLMSTRYGGDGQHNFCLPDLRPIINGEKDSNWNNGPRALVFVEGIYPMRP